MKNINKIDLAKLSQEVFNVADYISSNEKNLPAAARLIAAAERITSYYYDNADSDPIINELLSRDFEYDYHDYSEYARPEDLKHCDLALALFTMRSVFLTVNDYLASDIGEDYLR